MKEERSFCLSRSICLSLSTWGSLNTQIRKRKRRLITHFITHHPFCNVRYVRSTDLFLISAHTGIRIEFSDSHPPLWGHKTQHKVATESRLREALLASELSRTNEQTVVRSSFKSASVRWKPKTFHPWKNQWHYTLYGSHYLPASVCPVAPSSCTRFIPRYSSIALLYSANKAQMQFYCPDQDTKKFIALMPFISSRIGRVCSNWGHFS